MYDLTRMQPSSTEHSNSAKHEIKTNGINTQIKVTDTLKLGGRAPPRIVVLLFITPIVDVCVTRMIRTYYVH